MKYLNKSLSILGLIVFVIFTLIITSQEEVNIQIPNEVATTTNHRDGGIDVIDIKNNVFRNLKENSNCIVSKKLTFFDSQYGSNNARLYFTAKIPSEISPQAIGGGLGALDAHFREEKGEDDNYQFVIEVVYRDILGGGKFFTAKDYINNYINSITHIDSAPILAQNLSSTSVKIDRLENPEEVYSAFPQSDRNCINNFLREVDDLYLVTPISQKAIDVFSDEGVVMQGEDFFYAPWGLYAAKYVEGSNYPIIMHFVYYKDGGPFFKDKPYTIEDIMWSIRFGLNTIK